MAAKTLAHALKPALPSLRWRSTMPCGVWRRSMATAHSQDAAERLPEKLQRLYDGILNQDRACLARAITLVETNHPAKQQQGQLLLSALQRRRENRATKRIGISGSPGVGKSTFIESFGCHLINKNLKVAVLTIDPSSSLTGGSILGDKTRMPRLSVASNAYIRPSPTSGALGGVARNTTDAIVLCEAFGFDLVIVETVGVGQSEIAVADMVDTFMLLLPPAGGDELQGIKRGIMEMSDIIVVNKADGSLVQAANLAAAEYAGAVSFMRRKNRSWAPEVLTASALAGKGLDEIWDAINRFYTTIGSEGIAELRAKQYLKWMWVHIEEGIMREFKASKGVQEQLPHIHRQLGAQAMTPGRAAEELLDAYMSSRDN